MTSDVKAKLVDPIFLVCNVYSSGISAFYCLEGNFYSRNRGTCYVTEK